MNKLYTAVDLLKLLTTRSFINSKIVSEELGVSLRTAQRYLQEISSLPWVTEDPDTHSYSLVEDHELKDSYFSSSELAFVSTLLDFAQTALKKEDSGFLDKIRKKVFHANSLSDVYCMFNPHAIESDAVEKNRSLLEKLIIQDQMIEFFYTRKNRHYTDFKPYRILYHDGFWYAVGYHEDKTKSFSLDKMENIQPVRTFAKNPEYEKHLVEMLQSSHTLFFQDNVTPARVKILADADIAEYLKRRPMFPEQTIIEETEEGDLKIEFTAYNQRDCLQTIKRWIPNIRILEPAEYREEFARQLETSLEKNINKSE